MTTDCQPLVRAKSLVRFSKSARQLVIGVQSLRAGGAYAVVDSAGDFDYPAVADMAL